MGFEKEPFLVKPFDLTLGTPSDTSRYLKTLVKKWNISSSAVKEAKVEKAEYVR
jgi:hypothetical protein